jgi:hypothetical protein
MASSNRRWFQMLFNLDCSVAELEPVNREILDIAIRELLRSHRLGNHVVVISRPICNLLLDIADLTRADRAMLERIAHESTQKANLSKLASHYVNVTPIESDDLKIMGRAIHLSFERLGKSKVLERSVLLVENLRRDGLLYSELIRNHFDMHGCTPPSYEPMHGGGNDIGAVFVSQIKGERIVCGIVDSDRSSPIHPDSPKLRALLKISEMATRLRYISSLPRGGKLPAHGSTYVIAMRRAKSCKSILSKSLGRRKVSGARSNSFLLAFCRLEIGNRRRSRCKNI